MSDHHNHRLMGYARVSTTEQELNLQIDALLAHGVKKEHLYCDKLSGTPRGPAGTPSALSTLRFRVPRALPVQHW